MSEPDDEAHECGLTCSDVEDQLYDLRSLLAERVAQLTAAQARIEELEGALKRLLESIHPQHSGFIHLHICQEDLYAAQAALAPARPEEK